MHFVHLRGARDHDGGVGVRLGREEDVEVVVLSAPGVAREFQQVETFQCLQHTKIAGKITTSRLERKCAEAKIR